MNSIDRHMKPHRPDTHQWDRLAQQMRQEVMADIQRLNATRPKTPAHTTPVDDASVQWCEDVFFLDTQLSRLMGKLTTINHTVSILQGKEPFGPPARGIRRAGDEN